MAAVTSHINYVTKAVQKQTEAAAPSAGLRPRRAVKQQLRTSTLALGSARVQAKASFQKVGRFNPLRVVAAEAETSTITSAAFVPVLKFEELVKGDRQLVSTANGKNIVLFYYKNEIYAIENRSPSEGAYSDGFMNARFTQDGGISCPSTGTVFSLKTGEIMDWYPNNPVLRAITPQDTCRPMEVFPVKVDEEMGAICVDPINSNLADLGETWEAATTAGGSDTSAESNNVFGIEPEMYLETGEAISESSGTKEKLDPATVVISTLAIAIVAVAGSATCVYYENLVALAALWIAGFGAVAVQVVKYTSDE